MLIPRAAASIDPPAYFDKSGQPLPADAPGQDVAVSVYDIRIKPGIRFQPHPAFARNDAGTYAYWPISPDQLENKFGKIGRASCRERVCQYVSISGVAVSLKKTQ